MDPSACLLAIRGLIEDMERDLDLDGDALLLVDAVQSLDHWLSKGGFLPKQWNLPIPHDHCSCGCGAHMGCYINF